MFKTWLVVLAFVAGAATSAAAAPVTDGVLGRFVGDWTVSGTTRGKPAATAAQVRSEFGGAFVELHVKDPAGRSPYEARVFFGQADDGALVAHWLDATGGEMSRTLGRGQAAADRVDLVFAYPEGEMRNRLIYDRAHDRWRMLIEMGPKDQPRVFSDWYFDRAKSR